MADPTTTNLTRRHLAAAALAAAALPPAAKAQTTPRILMATWGGGVGDTWREGFAKGFTARTRIPVTINEVPDPTAQVRAQAGAPQYNAFVGTYVDAVNLHRAGLIETFDPAAFPRIAEIPPRYRLTAPDGRLLGMPVYFAYYGIAIATDQVKPAQMQSWKDLADPRWKGQLSVTRPVYASIYDLTVCAYAEGGDERNIEPGLPLFKRIAANAATVYSSMAQMNQLLTRGEIAAAPYYSTRIWGMKRDGTQGVDMVIPTEGALILPYIAMVPKGAFEQDAARQFLAYVAEPEPQAAVTDLAGYFPLNASATLSPDQVKRLGMSLDQLKSRLIQPDWFVIAADQQRRADLVEQLTAAAR